MNRLLLISILVLSTFAQAKAILPKEKLSEADYKALSRLDEEAGVKVELICKEGDTEEYQQALQQSGVRVIRVEEDKITIQTTIEQLNKIASFDWIVGIEKEGKDKKRRSVATVPSIIQAQVVLDSPSEDYQTQIQQIGARIIEIEGNVITIEVIEERVLNKIGDLNYVMKIDNIRELPKEKDKE